jgi:hypothetical protein
LQADGSLKSRRIIDKEPKATVGFTGANYIVGDSDGKLTKISRSRLKT